MARAEELQKQYTPKYYEKVAATGERIKPKQHAEEAAKYLAKTQWGDWEEENSGNPFEPLHTQGKKFNKYPASYKTNQISSEEVDEAICRTKKTKMKPKHVSGEWMFKMHLSKDMRKLNTKITKLSVFNFGLILTS